MTLKATILIVIIVALLSSTILVISHAYAQKTDEIIKSPLKPAKIPLPITAGNEKKVIIVYKHDVTDKDIDDLAKLSKKIKSTFKIIPAIAASVDIDSIEKIKSNKDVIGVFDDMPVEAFLSDSVPQIKANLVQGFGITGSGAKVCIVDTGVDDSHPALNPLVAEYDFINSDADATDDNGHGTHVAGIVASKDSTYRGVAFGASLMAAKVLDSSGSGFASDVISGIDWCVTNSADVISMSLGGGTFKNACDGEPVAMASNNAVDQGVVVFAATGNNGFINKIASPACASKVIAVGAVDKSDKRTSYSNEGTQLDIVAPGTAITSTKRGGGFVALTGTSMATPHASGTAALLLQTDPSLTPTQIRTVLRNTAVDLGAAGFDTIFGYGRIDARAAYSSINRNPTAQDDVYSVDEDMVLAPSSITGVLANDVDLDGNTLTALLVSSVSSGTLVLNPGGSFTYTPNPNFSGQDSFTYMANDGLVNSNVAQVTITVNPVNDPPIANAGLDQTVNEKSLVTLDGSSSFDADGDTLSYSWQELNQIPTTDIARILFENNLDDGAGGDNFGTVTGTTTFVDGKPGLGKAFDFNGATYIRLADETSFDFDRTSSFSTSLWVKTTSTTSQVLVGKSTSFGSIGWTESIYNGRVFVGISNTAATKEIRVASPNTLAGKVNDNNWHHVVVTYDGTGLASGVKIYLDNVLQTNIVQYNNLGANSILNNLQVSVGAGNGGLQKFTGQLDNLRIYGSTLTSSEVQALFSDDPSVTLSNPSSVVATFTAPTVAKGETKSITFQLTVTDTSGSANSDTTIVDVLPISIASGANIAELLFENNLVDGATAVNNDGTVFGTTTFVDGKPGLGKAFSFNGASYIKLANEADFDFERTDPFSVSLWVKPTTSTATQVLVDKASGVTSNGWNVLLYQGRLFVSISSTPATSEIRLSAYPALNDNQWHHVVVTYDGSSTAAGVKVYSDNVLKTNAVQYNNLAGSILNNLQVAIGATNIGGAKLVSGSEIDNVRIYNKVLTTSEISALFNEAT